MLPAYDGGRGWFKLGIWPQPTRYYLLGITIDPRGNRKVVTTTTEAGGQTTTVKTTSVEENGLLFTAMFGKVFYDRLDLSLGVLHGDGTGSAMLLLGPRGTERLFSIRNDLYSHGQGEGLQDRLTARIWPYSSLYFEGGVDSFKKVDGKTPYFYGAGISFDDEDIKLLFVLR
jgi:hypothetical protein